MALIQVFVYAGNPIASTVHHRARKQYSPRTPIVCYQWPPQYGNTERAIYSGGGGGGYLVPYCEMIPLYAQIEDTLSIPRMSIHDSSYLHHTIHTSCTVCDQWINSQWPTWPVQAVHVTLRRLGTRDQSDQWPDPFGKCRPVIPSPYHWQVSMHSTLPMWWRGYCMRHYSYPGHH